MTEQQQFDFNSSGFIIFLYKWRKTLLIVAIVAMAASFFFSSSWFITPKYSASVIMFPTSTNSVSKALLSESFGNKQDILEFGLEEQAEQLLQILNSNSIRARIIKNFGLMNHYGIDSSDRYKNTELYKEYDNNITFRRTEYMAVQISVLDKDPQMAADIANTIADLVDSVKNQMVRERALKAFKIVEGEYNTLQRQVAAMEDSMTVLRKLGVHDYETQSEMITQQLAIEIAKNNVRGVKALDDKLAVLAQYGGAYVSLREALLHDKKQLSMLKAKYAEAKVDAEETLPQKFIVNSAYKAEKKSYPVKWLIVLVTTVSSLLLAILILITIENLGKENIRLLSPDLKKKRRIFRFRGLIKRYDFELPELDMDNFFSYMNIFRLILKWKTHLLVVVLAAVILSAFFSSKLFITPLFKSTAVAYPSNISPYSQESETEQMLQLINSGDIRDSIIHKFNLGAHYGLNPSDEVYQSTLLYMYGKRVTIKKTEFESVVIEVLDTDPKLACDMVNAILFYFDIKVRSLQKAKFAEVVMNYSQVLKKKKNQLDSLQYLIDSVTSGKGMSVAPPSPLVVSTFKKIKDETKHPKNEGQIARRNYASKNGQDGEMIMLSSLAMSESQAYSEFKLKYDQAVLDFNRNYTYSNIVTKPFPADQKTYPKVWVIIAVTVLATFVLSLIIISIIENQKVKPNPAS